jgi:OOP family OmpA-OmpF porin
MRNPVLAISAIAAVLLPLSASAQTPFMYYEARVGTSFLSDADNVGPGISGGINVESEFDAEFMGELATGWENGNGFRGELAVGYNSYGIGTLTIQQDGGLGVFYGLGDLDGTSVSGEGDVKVGTAMLNGYYAFDLNRFQPFVGGGIGAAVISANISALGAKIVDDDDVVFAYQGIAGIEFWLSKYIAIGGRYSYFATTDPKFRDALGVKFDSEFQSHNILATIRLAG